MRAVIFGSVPVPRQEEFYRRLADSADLLVGADLGGVRCLDLGRTPNIAVGDFDSAGESGLEHLVAAGVAVERHHADKDASDLDLAVAAARGAGATEVVITAAFSERLDHTLAAIGTLLRASDLDARAEEPGWTAWPLVAGIRGEWSRETAPGATVSLLSPGGASGVVATGFRYPLRDGALEPLSSLGLANVTSGGGARVSVGLGSLLVIAVRSQDPSVR